jgi:nucleotide-binding universal stress UspA family protein
MNIEKILWPTDFSPNAEYALPYVTSLAEKYQAEIHILYVMKDYPAAGAMYGDYNPDDYEKMRQWEKQMAEKRLDDVCEKFLNSCPLYFRHIAVGNPAKEILKIIEKEHIDVVVMSSQGCEGHFQFGSVAEKVLKCSTIPVMTVPAPTCELT